MVFSLLRREAQKDLFPLARKEKVAVVAREPLMNGFLTGKFLKQPRFFPGDIREGWPPDYIEGVRRKVDGLRFLSNPERTMAQAALKFALTDKAVSTVIPGCKSEEHAIENFSASDCKDFSRQELEQLGASGWMAEI